MFMEFGLVLKLNDKKFNSTNWIAPTAIRWSRLSSAVIFHQNDVWGKLEAIIGS